MFEDRKDQRKTAANHMLVKLLGETKEIIQRQPKMDEMIFPYNGKSVTAGFQRVKKSLVLKIHAGRHLRREGACHLFEADQATEISTSYGKSTLTFFQTSCEALKVATG